MYLDDALRQLGEEKSIPAFPLELRETPYVDGPDDLRLDASTVQKYAEYCLLQEDAVERMLQAAAIAEKKEALATVAKSIFRAVFLMDYMAMCNAAPWPSFERSLGELSQTFYLVIVTGFVPLVKKYHTKAGYSDEMTRHTCAIIGSVSRTHQAFNGVPGILPPGEFTWMRNFTIPGMNYVHIGRFGFMTEPSWLQAAVYRHKKTKEVVAYQASKTSFAADGFASDGNPDNPEKDFESVFEVRDGSLYGNRITADGRAEKIVSSIPLDEYELMIGAGAPVLGMHIPSGGGMTPDLVDQSLRDAKRFFSTLPDPSKRPKAIICSSWIFNPNLSDFLPPTANLIQLQKRVHLIPRNSSTQDGLWFLFHHKGSFDPATAERRTSMQRAVLDYLEKGGRWRCGCMFLLMDEIPDETC